MCAWIRARFFACAATYCFRCSVLIGRIGSEYWEGVLSAMIAEHVTQTDSPLARELLRNWDREVGTFWQICPTEMISRLEHPLQDGAKAVTA